ncbi:hypothetical protein D1P53_000570 [Cryptococcus gattii VGV]|nr:hypothetical protein D1P53_000570 [Cryptococcus gattii VGV]
MPKLIIGIQIRPSTKRKSYGSGSSTYRRVLSDGCNPAAKRLRGNAAVLHELEEEDRIIREPTPSGPSFVQQSQNDSTSTVDGDNLAQDGPEWEDIDPGPWIPLQAEEEMEVGEDSWTETVNQFIWEQTQKNKPKEAQDQYRTAMIVWTNKWKDIRTDMFDTYLRLKRLSDEGDERRASHFPDNPQSTCRPEICDSTNGSACSDEWKAKNGGAGQGAFKGKEDTGIFALVCRHDFCIKAINQLRSAFLIWLLRYVDPTARLGLLYDIGCNFEAHLGSASPLSPYDGSDADELTTAAERSIHRGAQRNSQQAAHRSLVSVFHAYAHIWPCQIRYNPRMMEGFGWNDAGAAERLWSFMAAEEKLKEVAGEFNEAKLVEQWEGQKETTKAEGTESKERRAVYKKLINLVKARDQVVSKISEYEAQLKVGGLSEVEQKRLQLEESNATRQKVWRKLGEKKGKGMELKKEIVAKAAEPLCFKAATLPNIWSASIALIDKGRRRGRISPTIKATQDVPAGLAESIDKLKNRPEEEVFWMDALFIREDKLWAINRSCREVLIYQGIRLFCKETGVLKSNVV